MSTYNYYLSVSLAKYRQRNETATEQITAVFFLPPKLAIYITPEAITTM